MKYFSIMKTALLFVFALFIAQTSIAQKSEQKVFYLKDGSILRGKVIEKNEGQLLKIKATNNAVYSVKQTDIDSVVSEKFKNKNHLKSHKKNNNKYQGILEAGYLIATGEPSFSILKFNFVNALKIDNKYTLGVLVGIRHFMDSDSFLIPMFDFRYKFNTKTKSSVYIGASAGSPINLNYNTEFGGQIYNASLGFNIETKYKFSFLLGFDYEFYHFKSGPRYNFRMYRLDEAHVIGINVGMTF